MRFVLIIAALWMSLSIGHAQEPQQSDSTEVKNVTRAQISKLIALLNSRKLTTRRDAEQSLLVLGPDILPLLPAPELLPSIQVKQAVRRLRVRLEHQLARESIQASALSVSGQLSLGKIAELIEQQTGNELIVPRELETRKFPITWKNQPFWSAIGSLEKQSVSTIFNAKTGRFEFADRKPDTIAVWQQDAFRARLSPLTTKAVDDQQLIRCELNLTSEPRLRPLLLRYKSADWTLVSSDRQPTTNFNPSARFEIPLGESGREAKLQLNFLIRRPVDSASNSSTFKLSGKATLLTAAQEQPIRFTRLNATGVVRRRAGVSVNLQSAKLHTQDGVRKVRVQARVSYDIGRNAFESHQTWIFHNRVFLETKKGVAIALNDGFETLFHADGSVGVVYRFKNVEQELADLRFVYVAPTLLINVPLDIEFSNVKLPDGE